MNLADRLEASCTRHGHSPCLCRLAAYRIRDLEAALRQIAGSKMLAWTPSHSPEWEIGFSMLQSIARAALEERK